MRFPPSSFPPTQPLAADGQDWGWIVRLGYLPCDLCPLPRSGFFLAVCDTTPTEGNGRIGPPTMRLGVLMVRLGTGDLMQVHGSRVVPEREILAWQPSLRRRETELLQLQDWSAVRAAEE